MKSNNIRDILALPFVLVGMLCLYIGGIVGGEWTAKEIMKLLGEYEIK